MIQIAILGRGGQGAVKASQLLAKAAFYQGFQSQAFPFFGTERRGSPSYAFVRIDKNLIRTREHIHDADYLIVLDSSLIGNKEQEVTELKAKKILLNSDKKFTNAINFNAAEIAKEFPQAVNTVMVAAFCGLSGMIKKENLIEACDIFPVAVREANKKIIERVFSSCDEPGNKHAKKICKLMIK